MSQLQPVHLPDCFYHGRASRCGFEIRDVMPWVDAVAYVTDGTRFGVQFRSGGIEWLLSPVGDGTRAEQYRLAREILPPGVRVEASPRELVREIWRSNAVLLARMRASAPVEWAAVA